MNLSPPEKITTAQNTNLDTLFGLTNKTFEAFAKLVQLNLEVVKSTLAEIQDNAQKALSVKDPKALLALQASPIPLFGEKVLSYGRHVYEIALSTQAEFAKVAEAQYEAQYEAHHHRVQTLVDDIAKSAPAGSEAAVAAMQSAITAANTTYETIHKATQQAVEIVESNFDAASTFARQGVEQTSRAARRT
jgi:phasin family protein